MTDDPELWGIRQRRKGGMRVIGAAVATLLFAALWLFLAESTDSHAIMVKRRLVALGAGATGIALLVAGLVMLARAKRPLDPDPW